MAKYADASVITQNSLSILNVGQRAIASVGVVGMLVLAAIDVKSGAMSIGDLVMVNTLLVQLFIFGGFNSMQFSAMNSVTLKDMDGESASSGNSLLSMVQMLAMGMGDGPKILKFNGSE